LEDVVTDVFVPFQAHPVDPVERLEVMGRVEGPVEVDRVAADLVE